MIKIKPSARNTNKHTQEGMELLEHSINEVGVLESISVTKEGTIISGHARKEQFDKKGLTPKPIVLQEGEYPVIVREDIEDNTAEYYKAQILANTTAHANYNIDVVEVSDIAEEYGFEVEEVGVEVYDDYSSTESESLVPKPKKLEERFLIPPFSILDARQGRWTQRKNWWLAKGIRSEETRGGVETFSKSSQPPHMYDLKNEMTKASGGIVPNWDEVIEEATKRGVYIAPTISIFDPVLCEVVYRWFNIDSGKILDPFAGGSVRGIVAACLGYEYLGNDLRADQVEANRRNAKEVLQDAELYPTWTVGDSTKIDKLAMGYEADLLFSCPPYADLEVYSDDPSDISNMNYEDFLKAYQAIITKSCQMLKNDRFAVFVVGDIRDKKGFYRNFVSDTIQCFINAGMRLYNEIILAAQLASLPIKVARRFQPYRKVGKSHQNVLVFYKGDPKNIKKNFKELDLSYMEDENNDTEI